MILESTQKFESRKVIFGLDCEASRDARRGRSRLATFGTRMRRPWWLRLFQPVPRISDNVNVNVQPFAGGLVGTCPSDRCGRRWSAPRAGLPASS